VRGVPHGRRSARGAFRVLLSAHFGVTTAALTMPRGQASGAPYLDFMNARRSTGAGARCGRTRATITERHAFFFDIDFKRAPLLYPTRMSEHARTSGT